jgi:hypothetical protein
MEKSNSEKKIFLLMAGTFLFLMIIFFFGLRHIFFYISKYFLELYIDDIDLMHSMALFISFISSGFIIFYVTGYYSLDKTNKKMISENKVNLMISYFLCEIHFSGKNEFSNSVEDLDEFVSLFDGDDELTLDEEEIVKAAKLALVEWKKGEEWDYDSCLTLCFGEDFDWENFGELE